jgi:hypothetical protein
VVSFDAAYKTLPWNRRGVIWVVNHILFLKIYHNITLFWFYLPICGFLCVGSALDYQNVKQNVGDYNQFAGHDVAAWTAHHKFTKQMFKAEKNLWISMFATVMLLTIHRFRHDIEHSIRLQRSLTEAKAAATEQAEALVSKLVGKKTTRIEGAHENVPNTLRSALSSALLCSALLLEQSKAAAECGA